MNAHRFSRHIVALWIALASATWVTASPVAGQASSDNGLIQLALVMDQSYGNRHRTRELDADVLAAATRAFTDSRRFDVIERANLQALLAEKDLEDFIQKTNAGGLTDLEGVDMIGILSYDVERHQTGTLYRISVRLTNTKTGKVESTITSDRDAFKHPTTVYVAGQHLYENVKEKYPASGYVIEAHGELVRVDLGERDGIAKGDKIEVFKENEPIIHPVTGELLDGSVTRIAILKVKQVEPSMSVCQVKGDGVVQVGDRARVGEKNSGNIGILKKVYKKTKGKVWQ